MSATQICEVCRVHKLIPAIACERPDCAFRSPRVAEADGIIGVLIAEIELLHARSKELAGWQRDVTKRTVWLRGAVKAYGAAHLLPAESADVATVERRLRPGSADVDLGNGRILRHNDGHPLHPRVLVPDRDPGYSDEEAKRHQEGA